MAENSPGRKNAGEQNENDNDSERRIMGEKKERRREKGVFFLSGGWGFLFLCYLVYCGTTSLLGVYEGVEGRGRGRRRPRKATTKATFRGESDGWRKL